ncbi:MAG: hypothetical protein AAGJ87_13575 [Pseudomonadota bacterium]
MKRSVLAAAAFFAMAAPAAAATVSTSFTTADGFATGSFADVTIGDPSASVTFSGGQQQQMFDVQSYNSNPAAYLFVNGAFTGGSGNTVSGDGVNDDAGLIDFGGIGASSVSFFAANRGNGASVTLNILGVDDVTILGSISITQTSNQLADGAIATIINAADFGGQLIGAIAIDLPGPAANPPYVLAVDSFTAVVETPIPGAAALLLTGAAGLFGFRRKRKTS